MDYITESDLSKEYVNLSGDIPLSIILANSWLNSFNLPTYSDRRLIADAIKKAGVIVAKAFLDGNMFQSRDESLVTEKSVEAGSVKSSKKYSSAVSDQPISQDEVIALQLIKPFLKTKVSRFKQVRVTR